MILRNCHSKPILWSSFKANEIVDHCDAK